MYLPEQISAARVLITVKTYPLPSNKYEELVCTAGVLSDGKWIRVYPVPFRTLSYQEQYKKYDWIELNLVRNHSDFRPESYRPLNGLDEEIKVVDSIDTAHDWVNRSNYVLRDVHVSMSELIGLAKSETKKSLATLKPKEIMGFEIEEDEREWKKEWVEQLQQLSLLSRSGQELGKPREVVKKLPYKFFYKFLTEGDDKPRRLMIEDWEIGALYWNCLTQTQGNETEALELVRKKYFETFLSKNDIYFFLGTTKQFHNVAPNPFVIVGVYYPPANRQLPMF